MEEKNTEERLQQSRANASRRKYICHMNIVATKDFITELQTLIADGVKTGHVLSNEKGVSFTTSVNSCCIGNIDGNEAIIITEIKG